MDLNKVQTVGDILEAETNLFLEAEVKYGSAFKNAADFNDLLNNFISEVKPDAWIFSIFLSQIRKHHLLALMSATRLHHVQAMLNMRQVLEAGVNAAYGLANPTQDDFIKKEGGILTTKPSMENKRRQWLEKYYKEKSDFIKNMKNGINQTCAHSNIIYAFNNFGIEDQRFTTPFFDNSKEHWVKTDLWMIGNISLGLMDLFYGVNKSVNTITFSETFIRRLKDLEANNHKIKAELENG